MSDILLKSMHFPSLDARYIVGDETMSTEGAAADAKATGDALETKADKTDTYTKTQVDTKVGDAKTELEEAIDDLDERKAEIDGCYEGLTSGMAMGLVTDSVVEDKEPYTYRSLANLSVGRFCEDTLVGGSVVWNQLAPLDASKYIGTTSNVSFTLTDGVFTFKSLTDSSVYKNRRYECLTPGHKYFVTAAVYNPSTKTGSIGFRINDGMVNNTAVISIPAEMTGYERFSAIGVPGENQTCIAIDSQASLPADAYFNVKDFMVIDLTAALGSTIADYVYSLETANAGDGVAWFKKYFPGIYYGYAEPHFEHVQVSTKNTVGFNQWDEETANGYWDRNTGEWVASGNWVSCKNYIPCLPNTGYYFKTGQNPSGSLGAICFYDYDKNFISSINSGWGNRVNTTPNNAHYMTFYANQGYFKNDICINLHGDRDGEYEAYKKRTYPLDSSLTLRGIPKLDSANRLYFDGDVYEHDGTVTRRYGIVDLGTLNWNKQANNNYSNFYSSGISSLIKYDAAKPTAICSLYKMSANDTASPTEDNYLWFNANPQIHIKDTSKADMTNAEFKTAMSGVYLVYELATSTTETAEPFQSPMVVDPLGTEEFVDYAVEQGERDVKIPCGHTSEYPEDLVKKTEKMPSPTGTNGDYVITEVDGKLYLKPYVPAVGLTAPTSEGEGE